MIRGEGNQCVTVRGGLPPALIRWLIHDFGGPSARAEVLQFLQACKKDVPADLILQTVLDEFAASANSSARGRVLTFLGLWVSEFCTRDLLETGSGPRTPGFQRVLEFALEAAENFPELSQHVNVVKLGLLRGVAEWKRAAVPLVSVSAPDEKPVDLEGVSANEFAEQLTLVVHSMFAACTDDDLYVGDRAPNVIAMIRQWNLMNDWALGYLRSGVDDAAVTERVKHLLLISKRCLELSNYDSAFAFGLALDQVKLSKVWIERKFLQKTPFCFCGQTAFFSRYEFD